MNYKDFLEYLETNLDGYEMFMQKAHQFQTEKNMKRPAKSRWEAPKMEKATYEMWKKSMEALYTKLKNEIKSDDFDLWIAFVDKNGLLEIVNDGIRELDFSGEAA